MQDHRKKTSQECASVIKAGIKNAQKNLQSTIFAVVTDNENKMGKMWDTMKEKHPDLILWMFSTSFKFSLKRSIY